MMGRNVRDDQSWPRAAASQSVRYSLDAGCGGGAHDRPFTGQLGIRPT